MGLIATLLNRILPTPLGRSGWKGGWRGTCHPDHTLVTASHTPPINCINCRCTTTVNSINRWNNRQQHQPLEQPPTASTAWTTANSINRLNNRQQHQQPMCTAQVATSRFTTQPPLEQPPTSSTAGTTVNKVHKNGKHLQNYKNNHLKDYVNFEYRIYTC